MVVFTRSSTRSGEPPRPQPVRPPNEPNTSTEASVREVGPHALPSDIGIETKEVEPATKKRKRNTPTPKPKPRKKKPKTTQDSHARNTTGDDDARVGVETEEVGPPTNRRKREPITASPEARKKPKTIQDAPAQDTIGHDDTRRRTQEDSKKGRKPGPKRQSPIRVIRVEECRDGRSNERVQPLDIIADGAKEATTTPLGTNKTLSLSHQLQGDWNIEHSDVDIPSEHSSGTDDDHGERLTDAPTPGRELDIHAEKEDAFPELLSPPRRSWFLDDDDKVMSCYRRTLRSLGRQEFEPLACGEVSQHPMAAEQGAIPHGPIYSNERDGRFGDVSVVPRDSNVPGGCVSSVEEPKDAVDHGDSSEWEDCSDISDQDPAEDCRSRSESEIGDTNGESDGIRKPHIIILDKLLKDLSQEPTPAQASSGVVRYDTFIKEMGGAAAFKDHVLAKLDSDLLNFLETGDFSLETLKQLKATNSKIGHQPRVYLHVIYNPYHPHQVGLYIGSSAALIMRVARHKSERKNLQKAREWKKKQPYRSLHQNFWAKKGYQDFWLRLSDMDRPNNAKEIFDTDVLLNVLEKYLTLLFRSPQRQSLRLALPRGVNTDPFRWVGLNVADPLFQPRRSRSDSKTTNSTRNTSRRKRRRILFPHRNHSLQNLLFRFADRSKGDRAQIRLKCGVCSGSTHVIDRSPRYEIATGIYLSPSLRCQSSCVSRSLVPFVPFDASIAYKALSTAALAHRTVESRETAKDLTLASRTDVEQTPKLVLEAWIRDQGFACPKSSKKDIVEIADKIRLRLEDPENVDDTELLRPGRPHAARKGRVTVEPRDVANVTDLDGLSFHGLREWIRSQGWTKRLAGLNGAEMLELARRIWNETETVRHEILSRADLDDMTKANLRTWARSRGWTSNTEVLNIQEVLLLARRIWDDEISFDNTPLHAINQVQSRDDLRRLSRHKLAEWIKSKGYERARSDLSSTERMLNRAHMVWDRLNSAIDDNLNEAEDLKPTQTRPTRTIKDSRVPRTCSDLDEMNAVELETWMHLQGLSVPRSGRTREPLLSLTKKVWAALNNGRPLPEGVKMKRTSPEKISDIIYMRGESLKLWIKAQKVPIPYRLYHGTENIQSLAEEVWDAIQNGTLLNLRNKLSTGRPDKVKKPQTREDLKKMTSGDLGHWIGCKKVSLGSGSSKATKLSEILTLAETVWDAIKADTLDSLPKRNRAPPNKVKEPTAKDDFKRMTQADIWFWQSSKGVPVNDQDKTKARSIALGEWTWDAIQNDTLNELKSDYNARHIQTDAEVAAEAVLTKSGISFDVAGI